MWQNSTSTSVGLESLRLSPRPKIQSQRLLRASSTMTWLVRDDHGLFRAVQSQNETKVRQALKYGAGIDMKNAYGWTALHEAAECGHDKMVRLLLRYGANIDKKGGRRNTALHVAIECAHETVVQLLLRYGANIKEKDINKYRARIPRHPFCYPDTPF